MELGWSTLRGRSFARIWLAFCIVPAALILRRTVEASGDFMGFWGAAREAWSDPARSYLWEAVDKHLPWLPEGQRYIFWYPPPFLMLLKPFGALPYPAALALFIGLGIAVYLVATRSLRAFWPTVAFAAPLESIVVGQNGLLTGGLFIGAARLLDRRPWLAGALFGALIIKPHLALLVPVALIAGARWRAVGGAALSTLGLLGLSWLVLGPGAFEGFLSSVGKLNTPFGGRLALLQQTPLALVQALPAPLPIVFQASCSLAAAGVVAWVWRRPIDTEAKVAVLAAATAVAAPYLYGYDLVLLLLPILWLASNAATHVERAIVGLAFISPSLAYFVALFIGVNLGAAVHLLLLFAVTSRVLAPGISPLALGDGQGPALRSVPEEG